MTIRTNKETLRYMSVKSGNEQTVLTTELTNRTQSAIMESDSDPQGRKDTLHKLTTELIRTYDVICIENLNAKGMRKKQHLAISKKADDYGFEDYADYDVRVCGNDIIDIVLWVEKYSGIDTTEVREEIEKKRVWLRDNKKEYYNDFVGEDKVIFELWLEKGSVTKP